MTPMQAEKPKKRPAWMDLDEEVTTLAKQCDLAHIRALAQETPVPQDIAIALITMRPELIVAAQPRAMSEEEVGKLYTLIKALMATILAHQQHAEAVARLADNWEQQFTGLRAVGQRLIRYANFETVGDGAEEA